MFICAISFSFWKVLMTAVQELDQTLFEGYIKPKASVATGILRGGILDPNMDWYETPQPSGKFQFHK
jgi:exocyst complex component 2